MKKSVESPLQRYILSYAWQTSLRIHSSCKIQLLCGESLEFSVEVEEITCMVSSFSSLIFEAFSHPFVALESNKDFPCFRVPAGLLTLKWKLYQRVHLRYNSSAVCCSTVASWVNMLDQKLVIQLPSP